MFIIGSLPQSFDGFLRREYTRNLIDGHGDYYPCHIHGLRLVRGSSIQLQCVLLEGIHRSADDSAVPNNRVLWIEPAAWRAPTEARPDFLSLSGEWIAE